MLLIESLNKVYYYSLKDNRQVDDSDAQQPYQRVNALDRSQVELLQGKRLKIKGFPKDHKVQGIWVWDLHGDTASPHYCLNFHPLNFSRRFA
jgi:hypothetical protein